MSYYVALVLESREGSKLGEFAAMAHRVGPTVFWNPPVEGGGGVRFEVLLLADDLTRRRRIERAAAEFGFDVVGLREHEGDDA